MNLTIDLLEGLQERILEHSADFAIGSNIEPKPEIEAVPLFETCMVPVISPLALPGERLCARELKKFPQIIVTSSSKKSSNKVVGAMPGAKQWFTSDMLMKERLIVNKLGWGRLPLHQVGEEIEKGSLIEITKSPMSLGLVFPFFCLNLRLRAWAQTREILALFVGPVQGGQMKAFCLSFLLVSLQWRQSLSLWTSNPGPEMEISGFAPLRRGLYGMSDNRYDVQLFELFPRRHETLRSKRKKICEKVMVFGHITCRPLYGSKTEDG